MRLALLAATSLAGLALLPGAASAAPKPDCFETDFAGPCFSTFHDVFVDDVLCSFPVDVDVVGSIRHRPDADHIVFHATIVNPATGRSFVDPSNFTQHFTDLPDGSVVIRTTGVLHNARVDTGQRLFHQSGQHYELVSAGDELVEEYFHGRWDPEDAFPGEVCPMLAAPM